MRPKLHAIAALCAALLFAGAARAADVAVLPVQGTNLSPGETDAIGALLADAFAAEARVEVAKPADVARAITEAGALPAALAKLGVREYVEATAIQLRSRITLRAILRDSTGAYVHSAEMTAASLDDVQPVAARVARALVWRTSVERTRNLRNVTRREAQAPDRTFSDKVMGLKTAVIWPRASEKNFDPSVSLQFDGRLEAAWGFLEFGAGAVLPTDGSENDGLGGVFAEFGGSLYVVDANVSPYVGAGFVPRLYFTSDGGGANAAAYGQVGFMFMRQSSARIYAELRVMKALTPIEEELDYDYVTGTSSTRSLYPLEFAMQVGIGW